MGRPMELRYSVSAAAVVVLGLPAIANAGTLVIPPTGLGPGATYRLIFNSSGGTAATSSLESTYTAFAAAQAALNPALPLTTWYAITSTSSVSGATNIGACGPACTSDPIFLVTGAEVAADQTALFNTDNVALMHAIDTDQFGDDGSFYIWTGTNPDGSSASDPLGSSRPVFGNGISPDSDAFDTGAFFASDNSFAIFAISGELAVPSTTSTPEPASAAILLAGGALTTLARRLKRRGGKAGDAQTSA